MKHVLNWVEQVFVSPVLLYRYLKFGYTFRRIYLGEGYSTILDPRDYYRFRHYKWCVWGNGRKYYAVRIMIIKPGKTRIKYLHREIMKAPKGSLVDHRNLNPLDNRRDNLRFATRSENMQNRLKTKSRTSSRFIGVVLNKRNGRWYARIKYKRKQIALGCFEGEIEAAKAYDSAAKKYYGEFARLNFP